jgi:hypothetical protein
MAILYDPTLAIGTAYAYARKFSSLRKQFGYSRKEMNKQIAENLKNFYEAGAKSRETAMHLEEYRQIAIYKNSNCRDNYIHEDSSILSDFNPLRNIFWNSVMKLRIKYLSRSNPEIKKLSNKYFENTKDMPRKGWAVSGNVWEAHEFK